MPPWTLLDFAVVVPADSLGQPFHMHSCGWGSYATDPVDVFSEVAVSVGGHPQGEPLWVVATRPRRGIRPLHPADSFGADHLVADPDLAELAADAVSGLMLMTMRQDLPGKELSKVADQEGEQARAIAAALNLEPQPDDPWRREVLGVDGAAFALWVLDHARGWAAVGDLGPTRVVLYGTVRPHRWELSRLSPSEVAATFEELPGSRDVSLGDPGGQGWFGRPVE